MATINLTFNTTATSVNDLHRYVEGGKKSLTPQGIYLNKLKAKLIKTLGSDCRMCGHRKKLEFAHVKRTILCGKTGRGKCKRLYDVKNNLGSYILLCKRPCHLEFDRIHRFEHPIYRKFNKTYAQHKDYWDRVNKGDIERVRGKYKYREEDQHD